MRFASCIFLGHTAVLSFAMGVARVALAWTILERFGEAGLSLVVLLISCGQFGGALLAGNVTDRYDRKGVAAIASLASGGALLVSAALLSAGAGSIQAIAPFVCVTYFILAVHDNAARTLIPDIVEKGALRRLNGLFISIGEVAFFVAPVVAGSMVEVLGGGTTLVAAAALSSIAALLMMRIPIRAERRAEGGASAMAGTERVGLQMLSENRWLVTGLLAAAATNVFIVPINTLLVPIAIRNSGFGPVELGYFYSALSVGMAIGGVLKTRTLGWLPGHQQLLLWVAISVPPYFLVANFENVLAIIACGLLAGTALCIFEVCWSATMQERTPSNLLGRIYGLGSWTSFAGRATGVALAGLVIEIGVHIQQVVYLSLACFVAVLVAILLIGRVAAPDRKATERPVL